MSAAAGASSRGSGPDQQRLASGPGGNGAGALSGDSREPDLVITVGGTLSPAAPASAPPHERLPARRRARQTSGTPGPAPGTPGPAYGSAGPSPGPPGSDQPPGPAEELLARWAGDYVARRPGQQIAVLVAGCATATSDFGAARLQAAGHDLGISLIDEDQPVTRAAVGARPSLAPCTLGDLRTIALPPRSCDLVLCSRLLDRIRHAELVLDRLIAAVKPGGLLFLHIRDRDSAAGFLDRALPAIVRRLVWRRDHPGQPGPYPAIYEPLSSARGVQAYALLRGLAVADMLTLGGQAAGPGRSPTGFLAAQRLVGRLSRGRLSPAHEELLYVLRKPEDRFARVL